MTLGQGHSPLWWWWGGGVKGILIWLGRCLSEFFYCNVGGVVVVVVVVGGGLSWLF